MPFELPVEFSWRACDVAAHDESVEAFVLAGAIRLAGRVSLGGAGWSLDASAIRRRREIRITVVATQARSPAAIEPGLEELAYDLLLPAVAAGRYSLVVTHRCHLAVAQYAALGTTPLALSVTVPSRDIALPDAEVRVRGRLRARRRFKTPPPLPDPSPS